MHSPLSATRTTILAACFAIYPFIGLQDAVAAPPEKTATVREPVEIVSVLPTPSSPVTVYTVPAGKRLTITDVIISSGTGGVGSVYRNGVPVSHIALGGVATTAYGHSYVSGIVFSESQTISIDYLFSQEGGLANFELRGFLE